jgi:hypothetical protein
MNDERRFWKGLEAIESFCERRLSASEVQILRTHYENARESEWNFEEALATVSLLATGTTGRTNTRT